MGPSGTPETVSPARLGQTRAPAAPLPAAPPRSTGTTLGWTVRRDGASQIENLRDVLTHLGPLDGRFDVRGGYTMADDAARGANGEGRG